MKAKSRSVSSAQRNIHPKLLKQLERHRNSVWRKPDTDTDRPALNKLNAALDRHDGPVILDSFCGTGLSTESIARDHPDALVIGIDKSAHRLAKAPPATERMLFLQASCEKVWRHLARVSVSVTRHFILYPNPWPKHEHLSRRVYGHPAFFDLLKLGGQLDLRSNWQPYIEDFGRALLHLKIPAAVSLLSEPRSPTTLFERKYRSSGQQLWQLSACLHVEQNVRLDLKNSGGAPNTSSSN
ncbi:MAG: SAM-dependent methyltransferase [Pseudomonadota bacterium]